MEPKKGNTVPVILLGVSLASIAVTIVLFLSGFFFFLFFFLFFIPLSFGLPWSVKRLKENRRKWNVEDLR